MTVFAGSWTIQLRQLSEDERVRLTRRQSNNLSHPFSVLALGWKSLSAAYHAREEGSSDFSLNNRNKSGEAPPAEPSVSELRGSKLLIEFDPVARYEEVVLDYLRSSAQRQELPVAVTHSSSTIYEEIKSKTNALIIRLGFKTLGPRDVSSREIVLPHNDLGVVLDTVEKLAHSNRPGGIGLLVDSLTDLSLCAGFHKCYYFAISVFEVLPNASTIFLLNSKAHPETELSSFRALFPNHFYVGIDGLQTRKRLIDGQRPDKNASIRAKVQLE